MNIALRVVAYSAAIAVGVLAIIAGESDDSPGLQGLGIILLVYSLYKVIRIFRER